MQEALGLPKRHHKASGRGCRGLKAACLGAGAFSSLKAAAPSVVSLMLFTTTSIPQGLKPALILGRCSARLNRLLLKLTKEIVLFPRRKQGLKPGPFFSAI